MYVISHNIGGRKMDICTVCESFDPTLKRIPYPPTDYRGVMHGRHKGKLCYHPDHDSNQQVLCRIFEDGEDEQVMIWTRPSLGNESLRMEVQRLFWTFRPKDYVDDWKEGDAFPTVNVSVIYEGSMFRFFDLQVGGCKE